MRHGKGGKGISRTAQLARMTGNDFALDVMKELLYLAAEERARAIRMLAAVNETINRQVLEAPEGSLSG